MKSNSSNGMNSMNGNDGSGSHVQHQACAQFQNLDSTTPIMNVVNSNAKALDRMRNIDAVFDRVRSGTAVSAVSALTDVSDSELPDNSRNENSDLFGIKLDDDDVLAEEGSAPRIERV